MEQEVKWDIEHPFSAQFIVSPLERQMRIDQCNACDSLTILKTCKECGCIMPVKTWLKRVSCPLRKW